jgi:hypothetical protein
MLTALWSGPRKKHKVSTTRWSVFPLSGLRNEKWLLGPAGRAGGQCPKSVMFNETHPYQEHLGIAWTVLFKSRNLLQETCSEKIMYNFCTETVVRRNSWVATVTRPLPRLPKIRGSIPCSGNIFAFLHSVQACCDPHPTSYSMWIRSYYTKGKAADSEADRSFPSSVEVKNAWKHISTPPYVFVACN